MGLILTAFKKRNTYLRWNIKVMNGMGIFVSYKFHEWGLYQMSYFPYSKGNKIIFTHFIVDYMCKQRVES